MYRRLRRGDYPDNWIALSTYVRHERAQGQCECIGECGLHQFTPPGPRRCVERNHASALWAQGMVVLTTAHLCDATCPDVPEGKRVCGNVDHLRGFCQRCHLLTDLTLHMRHAAENRRGCREALGQVPFAFIQQLIQK